MALSAAGTTGRKTALLASAFLLAAITQQASAQDVPGIEICTVEKTMERRTSCLQSNIDFLQKTLTKLAADHQQRIDAQNRQIEGLKAAVVTLQKTVDDLQTAQKKIAEDIKAKADTPAKGATAPAKDANKDAK